MSDVKSIESGLDRLDSQIDDLEDALQPLLENLEGMSSELPLLDKAKLFSLTAYAIESLLFSSLKLEDKDAQNHAVFTELKRVQQYFAKIKAIEDPVESRNLTVNQEATARILKADLADNKTVSNRLAEKIAEERAKALLKTVEGTKRPAEEGSVASSGEEKGKKKQKASKPKSKSKSRR